MKRKWIGEEISTSGSYYATKNSELKKDMRAKLYIFNSRFGEEYYISDEEAIEKIEALSTEERSTELYEYLYSLVIEKFGIISFIVEIEHKIARERDNGYREGKRRIQQEMRQFFGINSL